MLELLEAYYQAKTVEQKPPWLNATGAKGKGQKNCFFIKRGCAHIIINVGRR